jgi:hypothetical protein
MVAQCGVSGHQPRMFSHSVMNRDSSVHYNAADTDGDVKESKFSPCACKTSQRVEQQQSSTSFLNFLA